MTDIFDKIIAEREQFKQNPEATPETTKDIFDVLAAENRAVEGDVFDQQKFIQNKVKNAEDPVLSEPSFFKGYYNWLHQKPERAKSFGDWLGNVVPKSISRTTVGLVEFPFLVAKSVTDPALKLAEDVVGELKGGEGKEIKPEEAIHEVGKAAWELVDGIGKFVGEPLGLYGWEKFKDKWMGDPAAAVVATLPIVKGAAAEVADIGLAPTTEFGVHAKGIKGMLQKTYDFIDVQAPFIRAAAIKTGIMIKKFNAKRIAEQIRFLELSKTLAKLRIPKEQGLDITLEAAKSPKRKLDVSNEVKYAAKAMEAYYKDSFNRLKQDGVLKNPWPESYILRNEQLVESLTTKVKSTKAKIARIEKLGKKRQVDSMQLGEHRRTLETLETEIAETNALNERLRTEDPSFVHIPLNTWYRKIREQMGEQQGQRVINSYYRGRFFHQRSTVDIADTIDWLKELKNEKGAPIFEPLDFDARMIGASYAQQIGTMRGLADIFNAAKSDGLVVKKTGTTPKGYGEPSPQMVMRFPELKNSYIHNSFHDYLAGHFNKIDKSMELGRVFGYTKMMAFWNPIFLPAYDLWQASWLTGSGFQKGFKEGMKQEFTTFPTVEGIKSYFKRDKDFYRFQESGATATPYTPPFDNFRKDIEGTIYGSLSEKALDIAKKRAKNPAVLVDDFYKVIWNMAWSGDGAIRMGTWKYLKELGMTDLEAGQMTSYVHGAYDMIAPGARQIANKIFFTPSFKYAMGHIQANMVRSSAAVVRDAMKIKKPHARDLMLSKGFAMLMAGSIAKDKLMERFEFKKESSGLRYVKEVDTPQGKRELVLYWPDPNNVILRQYYKWTKWGDDPERLDEFINKGKWDLHPLWQLGIELIKNDSGKSTDRHIYNPFDAGHPEKIAWDIIDHSVKKIVGAVGAVESVIEKKDAMSAYTALQKEVGWLNQKFLSAATLAYMRHTPTIKGVYNVRKLERLFKKFQLQDAPKTNEEATSRLRNYFERMREISDGMQRVKK